MEHLVDPAELAKVQAFIQTTPWLDFDHDRTQEYRLVPFEEYPLQRGWTAEQLHSLRLGGFKDTDPASALAMLQCWLFFGLLESAFQERFPSRSFIFEAEIDTDDCRVLNTAYLRTYYQQWHLSFLDLPDERKTSLSRSFAQSLHGPRDWVLFLAVKLSQRTREYNTLPLSRAMNATIRTTLLLMDLLGSAVPQNFSQNPFVHQQIQLDPGDEIFQWMRQRKWCPSSCRALMKKYGTSVMLYATLLEPAENSFVTHNACDRGTCVAYNVDVPSYEPRHLNEGCSCEKIGPPVEDVYTILRSGSFPLLDGEAIFNDDSEGKLVVRPYESGTAFLAFSHVWSDGLGGVTEDGLPRCQVVYLSRLTRVISGSTLFWIDALCVPWEQATRTTAINRMSSTYNSASVTLVLDAGMRKCSIERPLEEILLRILASVWMRRLWTLHEGALAGRLVFLLRDYLLDLNELLGRIFSAGFSGPISAAALHELSGFNRKLYATTPAHINHVQRLLGFRTSSRLDDETLAIAPLFHIDAKRLTSQTGERRKIEFWNCLRTVPTGIIFSVADRLTTRGYRWAPNSLLHGDATDFGPGQGMVTDQGMVGEFMLLELEDQLRVEVNKSYQLLDVVHRKAFRLFDRRDIRPGDLDQEQSSVCDALVIRQQPAGELVPGSTVFLVRDPMSDEDEIDRVVEYGYGGKLMIVMDEFAELVSWEDLPRDAIIVRSGMKKIRIS